MRSATDKKRFDMGEGGNTYATRVRGKSDAFKCEQN